MGDTRFEASRDAFEAARRTGGLPHLSVETALQALGALAARKDPLAANILTTRLLNDIRRSSTLLRCVAEGVVALDAEGRVQFANPAAEQLLGHEKGALLGQDFHHATRHQDQHGRPISREECGILRAAREAAVDADTVRVDNHDVFERVDGTTFMVGFVAAPIVQQGEPAGLAVVFRDISESMDHEARLALHAAALDGVPLPVFWLAQDGSILYGNAAAGEHLGYSREELTRLKVFDFDIDFPPERWKQNWEDVKRPGARRVRSRHRTREGRVVPVDIWVQHVAHDHREFHVAIVRPTSE